MEGKRGRGKPRIMMLDDIKADETYEKIKRRVTDRECWRNCMPRTCFQSRTSMMMIMMMMMMMMMNLEPIYRCYELTRFDCNDKQIFIKKY